MLNILGIENLGIPIPKEMQSTLSFIWAVVMFIPNILSWIGVHYCLWFHVLNFLLGVFYVPYIAMKYGTYMATGSIHKIWGLVEIQKPTDLEIFLTDAAPLIMLFIAVVFILSNFRVDYYEIALVVLSFLSLVALSNTVSSYVELDIFTYWGNLPFDSLEFAAIVERYSDAYVLVINGGKAQIFGYMSGKWMSFAIFIIASLVLTVMVTTFMLNIYLTTGHEVIEESHEVDDIPDTSATDQRKHKTEADKEKSDSAS